MLYMIPKYIYYLNLSLSTQQRKRVVRPPEIKIQNNTETRRTMLNCPVQIDLFEALLIGEFLGKMLSQERVYQNNIIARGELQVQSNAQETGKIKR